jgi:hypothetical protein
VNLSRKDLLCNLGVPTTRRFSKDEPVTLRNIQAVAAVPDGFGLVKSIVASGGNAVMLTDKNGLTATAAVDWTTL